MLRRVTLTNPTAVPLGFTSGANSKYRMIKSIILTLLLIASSLVNLNSQESTSYHAKCRLRNQIGKYRCAYLKLNTDSTYNYEELFDDLVSVIESGSFSWDGDTLLLETKNSGTIKYLKKKKLLIPQSKTDDHSFEHKLKLNKAKT